MATKTEVRLIDDLDGETPADTTVRFGLDSREYEIDLSDEHAAGLRETFSRYVNAARKVSKGRQAAAAPKAFDGVDGRAVRAWAKSKGIDVSPRGRISRDVLEQYRAAGN